MIEKYAIAVVVPSLGNTFEFLVPSVMEMKEVKALILKMISEQYPGLLEQESTLWYIDYEAGMQVPEQSSLKESGLKNGSKIMLLNVQ